MKEKLVTSVSLPADVAVFWRERREEIMRHAERFLRIQMRNSVRRAVTRRYNRNGECFTIVTTRFSAAEYDTLHFVAASLRVSVSSLIYGLLKLWLKPSRRVLRRFFATNYDCPPQKWDAEAGFVEENLIFWRISGPETTKPPPWLPLAT